MPATFKITLAHKSNADGLYEVWLRITVNRVPRYASTGMAVALKQWNPNGTLDKENWIRGHREQAQFNTDLVTVLLEAKRLSRAHPLASADELKQLFINRHKPAAGTAGPDFVRFMQQSLEQVDRVQFKAATYENRRAVIQKFAAWRPALPFSELSEELMASYELHMKTAHRNNATTRKKNLGILAIYIGRAIKQKLLHRADDPLADYEMPRSVPTRVWLTDAELSAYEQVPLPPMQHLARLSYLLCFYLHGSRIAAVLRLRWRDRAFGRVSFSMDKGGTHKTVEEVPQLTAILDALQPAGADPDAFILPWLDTDYDRLDDSGQLQRIKKATAKLNKNIKAGAAKAGITKKLSTHSSRRTLATESDRANGGDLGKVGAMLGHRQRSTTEIYIDRYNSAEVDEAARNVYKNRPIPVLKAAG